MNFGQSVPAIFGRTVGVNFNSTSNIEMIQTMTRKEAKEMLLIIRTFANGETIECNSEINLLKEVLLSFRRNLQDNARSECIEGSLTTFNYV